MIKRLLVALVWVAGAVSAALAVDKPIEADKLLMRDSVNQLQRKLTFRSNDPNITFGVNGDTDTPTTHGASLLVFNPVSGENQCMILPASNWVIGNNGLIYIYKDRTLSAGPVKTALIKAGRLKVRAQAAGITFTLDETSQGTMALHYTSGTGNKLCAYFPIPRVDQPNIFSGAPASASSCQTEPVPCVPPGP
jgi:hypothetical protein